MKILSLFLLLTMATAACQPHTGNEQAAALVPVAPAAAAAKMVAPGVMVSKAAASLPAPATPIVSVDSSLPPAALNLLRQHSIATLLQSATTIGDTMIQEQNGFFGLAGYRLEMVLTKVQRDSAQPAVFQVRGKSRYKKVITPFTGSITITKLINQPECSIQEMADEQKSNMPNMYTAIGKFEFREDATQRGAGIFRGQVFLDFCADYGVFIAQSQTVKTLTQGGIVKYEGTWTNNTTGHVVPVVWVEDILNYQGSQVFSDFVISGRAVFINPKYQALGWSEYYQNDEWWANSPAPKLSL